MKNKWLFIAALSSFCCVALGAFAAHGLANILSPKALAWIDTGLKYQMLHSLAIMGIGILQLSHSAFAADKLTNAVAASWGFGILLFSGSLYALAFGASLTVAWLTPIGGSLFLIGWLLLAYRSIKTN